MDTFILDRRKTRFYFFLFFLLISEMELEGLFPFDIDYFDDSINFRTAYKKLFKAITRLGKYTTKLLRKCVDEDEEYERYKQKNDFMQRARTTFMSDPTFKSNVGKLFDVWMEYFVRYAETMREVQMYLIEGRKIRTTLGTHVFTELTRLNYLLQRPRLMVDLLEEEMQSLDNTHHPSWISIVNSFDITTQYEEKEDKDLDVESRLVIFRGLWKKPVLYYTQIQAQMVVMFLTQQLNEVREDSIFEFKSMFEWLWIRISELLQEAHPGSILDDPHMRICIQQGKDLYLANRDFGIFVSFYMGEIARRMFYYNMLNKRMLALPGFSPAPIVPLCKLFMEHVIRFFAEEAFTDIYVESCNESYAFVGDDVWYKYRYPLEIHSRAACLAKLRPHLYRQFFSESRASRASVISSINTKHISRAFAYKALSQYIQIKLGGANEVKWYKGVIIHSSDIPMSTYNLRSNMAPFLLQVLSTYWAYDQGCVWRSDDFYESLSVWFYLLRKNYGSCLFEHDLRVFVNACIGAEKEQEKESLERGQDMEVHDLPVGFLL